MLDGFGWSRTRRVYEGWVLGPMKHLNMKTGQIAEVIRKNAEVNVCSKCRTYQPIWLMSFTGWAMPKYEPTMSQSSNRIV